MLLLALLGELGGTYAVWRWLRTDAAPVLALLGVAAAGGRPACSDPLRRLVAGELRPPDRGRALPGADEGPVHVGEYEDDDDDDEEERDAEHDGNDAAIVGLPLGKLDLPFAGHASSFTQPTMATTIRIMPSTVRT
jgi:hypothetical protein